MSKAFQATQTMSNLDLFYLLRELRVLEGARLSKAYGFAPNAPNVFRFKFKASGGELNLHVDLSVGMWLTKYLREPPRQPDAFVTKLRKDLENAPLSEVKQLNFDRVVSLVFSTKVGERVLIVEFVGNGNLLLLDENKKIIQARENRNYVVRKLRAGARYVLPSSEKKNPSELNESDLRGLRGGVVSALFKKVNLSPFYLEEACARAGIEFCEKIEELEAEKRKALADACRKLLAENSTPRVYVVGGRAAAFAPFELKKLRNAANKEFESFSRALDAYYAELVGERGSREEKAETRFEKELSELRALLSRQELSASALDNEAREKKLSGDWICANSGLVERVIEEARALKSGVDSREVERRIAALSGKIKKTSIAGAELIIETGE